MFTGFLECFEIADFLYDTLPRYTGQRAQRLRPPLPVGFGNSDCRVAGLAERLKVGLIIRAAFLEGDFVVDFGCRNIATGFKAKLADRMLLDVQVADRHPSATVKFTVSRTVVLVIFAGSDGLMVRTIALGRKLRTAGIGTGMRGFGWHGDNLLMDVHERNNRKFRSIYTFYLITLFTLANHMT